MKIWVSPPSKPGLQETFQLNDYDHDDGDDDDEDCNDNHDDINDYSPTSSPPPLVLNKEQFSNGYGRPEISYHNYMLSIILSS